MSDIFEEAKLEASSERKFNLFYKSLPYIFGLGFICAVTIAVYYWQTNKTLVKNQNISDLLVNAITSEAQHSEDHQRSAAIDSIISLGVRQSELAELKAASILIQQNSLTEAKAKLVAILENDQYRLLTRRYAKLLWMSLIIDQANISESEKVKIEEYFRLFAPDLPYYGMASILEALYYYKIGQIDKAEAKAEQMVYDGHISPMLKEQARMLILNCSNVKAKGTKAKKDSK